MGLRAVSNTKDQLPLKNIAPTLVPRVELHPKNTGSLKFFTEHPTKPTEVDLTVFANGEKSNPRRTKGGTWSGPFSGRPELIQELLPALHDRLLPLAEQSVTAYTSMLRSWWRLLDGVEAQLPSLAPVASISQITDVHRQRAFDIGMRRLPFSNFLSLVNATRAAKGMRQLFWIPPEDKGAKRTLPPPWQTDYVRHALKHHWFATLDRWHTADALRAASVAADTPELERLALNYRHFDAVVKRTGKARPTLDDISSGFSLRRFYKTGLNLNDMLQGSFPTGDDIRAVFHLCLATTGWNPAVLLKLDVTEQFVEAHPKDPGRFILRSTKARAGGTEQLTEGLFKTQSGAGFVVQALLARTAPLRAELQQELAQCKEQLDAVDASAGGDDVGKLRKRIAALEQGVRSVWLFTSMTSTGVQWLDDYNFAKSLGTDSSRYLGQFIADLNKKLPSDRQLVSINASDLRDVYAARVYRATGGSVLAVMKALGHRNVNTTVNYLTNTLLKEEHRRLFATFHEALWTEIESSGRVDPTVIAKVSRDGSVTPEERRRLADYRVLMTSRVGTKCKDPLNPPRHIAPDFVSDGQAMCHVQRCTLCLEHAIVTPESLPGLSRRAAELRHLRGQMSVGAFQESSFLEELGNTELALLGFEASEVEQRTSAWTALLASGEVRVAEFDGIALP